MVIVEGIEHLLTSAPLTDQPGGAQQAELMRHCRFAQPEHLGDISDAEFLAGQDVEDANARGCRRAP